MPTTTGKQEVLIVGAGPTGLILAYELLRRGVPIRQIEKRDGPSDTTRAFTLHARTMEMFEHIGVAHRLEEICLACPGNIFHFHKMPDHEKPRLDFRAIPSRYAFYYKMNQNDFEQALREHLLAHYSHAPEYNIEALRVEAQDMGAIVAMRRRETGQIEKLEYPWVVGCDGAHSVVRKTVGIKFPGQVIGVMAMMDVKLTRFPYDDSWVNYFIGKDLFMLVTKLPGKFWRMYLSDAGKMTRAKDPYSSFQAVADELDTGIIIGEPGCAGHPAEWAIPNNIAETYRRGRVLLCGDASHVHSPAGGQGMNACLQDAFNLGWKLANVIYGAAPEEILDTYEQERKPIGRQVSLGAKATHDIVMAFGRRLEDRIAMTKTPGWHDNAVRLISGLSHNYRDVVRIPKGIRPVEGPKPGERAPDAILRPEPKRRVYDVLRHPGFTLLAAPGHDARSDIETARSLVYQVDELYPGKVRARIVSSEPYSGFDFDQWAPDETGEFRGAYSLDSEGRFVLTRPDMYIGLNCGMSDWDKVIPYLSQWFQASRGGVC